jgi:hypothetical protein
MAGPFTAQMGRPSLQAASVNPTYISLAVGPCESPDVMVSADPTPSVVSDWNQS